MLTLNRLASGLCELEENLTCMLWGMIFLIIYKNVHNLCTILPISTVMFTDVNFAKINIKFYSNEACKRAILIYFVYKANLFISTMSMPYIVGFSCLINARKFVKKKVLGMSD